jgi:hypothetical protein
VREERKRREEIQNNCKCSANGIWIEEEEKEKEEHTEENFRTLHD